MMAELSGGMDHVHAWRVRMLTCAGELAGGVPMSAPLAVAAGGGDGRWRWPIDPGSYDTTPAVRAAETAAIAGLGVDNLRRLGRGDRAAAGWQLIRRLLRPLDDAAAAMESPPTSHRRRAMLDASAVVLLRCAQAGRSYWAWADEEWAGLLGRDQDGFRKAAPGWADDAVRPYLAAHAFLLGGFTNFCQLGRLHRLTLARRVFGHDRVDGETRRLRPVLAERGCQLGREDDTLLPRVAGEGEFLAPGDDLGERGAVVVGELARRGEEPAGHLPGRGRGWWCRDGGVAAELGGEPAQGRAGCPGSRARAVLRAADRCCGLLRPDRDAGRLG